MEKKEKFLLNSRDQSSPEELKELQRLLEKEYSTRREEKEEFVPFYGDVTKLNVKGTILDLVGKDTLETMCSNAIQLLGTSLAIYEKDGDYAFGMFVSDWCRYMDEASRRLCNTDDNKEALANGKWLCHENCWNDSAKVAITTGKPTDIECIGGIRLYAEPIFARDKVIGAINIGYGNPPVDETGLKELAQKFRVPYQELLKQAKAYYPRPPFIITIAKKRLHNIAILIGKVVENVQNERKLRESEEQFKTITESSADAIFITDQKGNFVYVNQGAERLLGYTRRELLKKNNSDFYQPEDIGEFNVD
ncbi:MAG TPA: PAS domain S-box protein, partial [Atribacterota bacterium]|nr:PAS domain S-box protein [Atribacterota bacterium]